VECRDSVKPQFTAVEEKFILECVDKETRSLRQVAAMVEQRKPAKSLASLRFALF